MREGTEQNSPEETVVPVREEELVTGTRPVKTGSVRVRKEVSHTERAIEVPLVRDVISIERVPVNRVVDEAPDIREEGDTLIIPVVAEEIVVEKRLVLKEVIRVQRSRVSEAVTRTVTLGSENVMVERLDADGNVVERCDAPLQTSREP